VCDLGIQVYGGYGYIKEYPVEQLLRDCRITPIYEGTNGIQAMDLLFRKLGQNGAGRSMDLADEIQAQLASAGAAADRRGRWPSSSQALIRSRRWPGTWG
jgi:hypothetical protein